MAKLVAFVLSLIITAALIAALYLSIIAIVLAISIGDQVAESEDVSEGEKILNYAMSGVAIIGVVIVSYVMLVCMPGWLLQQGSGEIAKALGFCSQEVCYKWFYGNIWIGLTVTFLIIFVACWVLIKKVEKSRGAVK